MASESLLGSVVDDKDKETRFQAHYQTEYDKSEAAKANPDRYMLGVKTFDSVRKQGGVGADVMPTADQLLEIGRRKERRERGQAVEDAGGDFWSGLNRAVGNMHANIYGAGSLGGKLNADEDSNDELALKQYRIQQKAAREHPARFQDFTEVESLGDAVDLGQQIFGEVLPSQALSMMGGVAGRGAGAILGGLAGLSGGPGGAAAGAAAGGILGATLPTMAIEAGGMWGEARQRGINTVQAALTSAGLGVVSGLLELVGGNVPKMFQKYFTKNIAKKAGEKVAGAALEAIGKEIPQKAAGKFVKQVAVDTIKNMAEEAGQEISQEALGILNVAINDDAFRLNDIDNLIQLAQAGLGGAIGGISGAGAQLPADAAHFRRERTDIDNANTFKLLASQEGVDAVKALGDRALAESVDKLKNPRITALISPQEYNTVVSRLLDEITVRGVKSKLRAKDNGYTAKDVEQVVKKHPHLKDRLDEIVADYLSGYQEETGDFEPPEATAQKIQDAEEKAPEQEKSKEQKPEKEEDFLFEGGQDNTPDYSDEGETLGFEYEPPVSETEKKPSKAEANAEAAQDDEFSYFPVPDEEVNGAHTPEGLTPTLLGEDPASYQRLSNEEKALSRQPRNRDLQSPIFGESKRSELLDRPIEAKQRRLGRMTPMGPDYVSFREEPYEQAPVEPQTSSKGIETAKGEKTNIVLPGQKDPVSATWALVEADALVPSHNSQTFAPDQRYPEGVQERRYHREKEEQAKVVRNAIELKPDLVLGAAPTMTDGPPAILPNGVVMGGNSRTMTLQRAYQEGKQGAKYKAALADIAHKSGFTREQVEAMNRPILVRMLDQTPTDQQELHRMASAMNVGLTQAMGEKTQTASYGQNVSADTIAKIGERLTENGNTLRGLMDDANYARETLDRFVADGVISANQIGRFWDEHKQAMTRAGKDLAERAILGAVIKDADLLEYAPGYMINKIEKSLSSLAPLMGRKDGWNITNDLQTALRIAFDAKRKFGGDVDAFLSQKDFTDTKEAPHRAKVLADWLVNQKPNSFREAMKRFAADASNDIPGQASMFEKVTPEESFHEWFEQGPAAVSSTPHIIGDTAPDPAAPDGQGQTQTRIVGESSDLDDAKDAVNPIEKNTPNRIQSEKDHRGKAKDTAPEPDKKNGVRVVESARRVAPGSHFAPIWAIRQDLVGLSRDAFDKALDKASVDGYIMLNNAFNSPNLTDKEVADSYTDQDGEWYSGIQITKEGDDLIHDQPKTTEEVNKRSFNNKLGDIQMINGAKSKLIKQEIIDGILYQRWEPLDTRSLAATLFVYDTDASNIVSLKGYLTDALATKDWDRLLKTATAKGKETAPSADTERPAINEQPVSQQKSLSDFGMRFVKGTTKTGKPMWTLMGSKKEHASAIKTAARKATGKGALWNMKKRAWYFFGPTDPTSALLEALGAGKQTVSSSIEPQKETSPEPERPSSEPEHVEQEAVETDLDKNPVDDKKEDETPSETTTEDAKDVEGEKDETGTDLGAESATDTALDDSPAVDDGLSTETDQAVDDDTTKEVGEGNRSDNRESDSIRARTEETRGASTHRERHGNADPGPDGRDRTAGKSSSQREDPAKDRGLGHRPERIEGHGSSDHNHVVGPDDILVPGGAVTRAKANIKAIELYKALEKENRPATPEEKKVFAQFTGWGSLSELIFKNEFDSYATHYQYLSPENYFYSDPKGSEKYRDWESKYGKALHPKLGGIMTEEEWAAARLSTLNAHYTSREVIEGMWDLARRLGFKGGRVLEPAAGVGHFLGLMPQDLSSSSRLVGVELDNLTAGILSKLYEGADIQNTGFQNAKRLGNNTVDLVISNFPFSKADKVMDKKHPDYDGWSVHNYFFARSLDVVKPGGLVIAITSRYTLDSANRQVRQYLSSKADFVGAIRLPGTAFEKNAGTSVTTDVLVFRKKADDGQSLAQDFQRLENVSTPEGTAVINEYFVNNPEMVLGKHSLQGSMYRGDNQEYTLKPNPDEPLAEGLARAANAFPPNIAGMAVVDGTTPDPQESREIIATEARDGVLTEKDGVVYEVIDGELVEPFWDIDERNIQAEIAKEKDGKPTKKQQVALSKAQLQRETARAYIPLKNLTRDYIAAMGDPDVTDKQIKDYQRKLNKLYDDFVSKYGYVNKPQNEFLNLDLEFPNVMALEIIEESYEPTVIKSGTKKGNPGPYRKVTNFCKADLFTKRTKHPFHPPTSAQSVSDALALSEIYKGGIDLSFMARLLGYSDTAKVKSEALAQKVVFEDPETGLIETPEKYLSGNVRKKLETAQSAVKDNPEFQRNVDALLEVQPAPRTLNDIDFSLGSTWLPTEVIKQYLRAIGVENANVWRTTTKVDEEQRSEGHTSHRSIGGKAETDFSVRDEHGYIILDTMELVKSAINFKRPKVRVPDPTDPNRRRTVVDKALTEQANQILQRLDNDFVSWVKSGEAKEVGALAADTYNKEKNFFVAYDFQPVGLDHFPGANKNITLMSHQKRAVGRCLRESTLLAHGVGAGKTFELATIAMEMRRIGTAKKPLIAVHGPTLAQFVAQFKTLYPSAKILAPNERQREAKNRKRLLSQIAYGDYDAVIIPLSYFNGIAMNPERERAFIQEKMDEIDELIQAEGGSRGRQKSPTVKQLEAIMQAYRNRLQKLMSLKQDEAVWFEELGVDALLVDEAHAYKRGEFFTQMERVKGLNQSFSMRSMQLLMKARYIQEKTGGKNVILATGTPISNTIAETWVMMRYIRPDLMEEFGVTSFDDFAGAFCLTNTEWEETETGHIKPVTRFNRYTNGFQLLDFWKSAVDIALPEFLPDFKGLPDIKGGRPQEVLVDRTEEVADFIEFLKEWRESWDNLDPKTKREQSYVPILIYGLAKKASIDLRLIDPDKYGVGAKTKAVVNNVYKRYKEHGDDKAAQVIFSDLFNSSDKSFNLFQDLKQRLIKKGIPAEEIAIIHDYKPKAQENLFAKVNAGQVRIIMGTTEKLGVGVNIQARLKTAHHLDVVDRPMDFEQRNGRIRRQGNMYKEVEILNYGTKNTLDSVLFQRLLLKQKFINQLLMGEISESSFDDPFSVGQLSFAEMQAAFAGNPMVIKKVKVESEIRRLNNLLKAHEDQQRLLEGKRDWLQRTSIPARKEEIKNLKSLQALYKKTFPENGRVTHLADDKDRTWSRDDFNKWFNEKVEQVEAGFEKKYTGMTLKKYQQQEKDVATFNFHIGPFQIQAEIELKISGAASDKIKAEDVFEIRTFKITEEQHHFSAFGNFGAGNRFLQTVQGTLTEIPSRLIKTEEQLKGNKAKVKSYGEAIGQPFPEQGQLDQALKDMREIEADLENSEPKDEPAKSEAQQREEHEKKQRDLSRKIAEIRGGITVSDEEDSDAKYSVVEASHRPGRILPIEQIQKIFPGQNVKVLKDGAVRVTTKNGKKLIIDEVDFISPNAARFQMGWGRDIADDEIIAGKYSKNVVTLTRDAADKFTLGHEATHWLEDAGILTPLDIQVLKSHIKNKVAKGAWKTRNKKDVGGSEDRADFLSEYLNADHQGAIKRIFQRVNEWLARLWELATGIRTAAGVMSDVRTGRIYKEQGTDAAIPGRAATPQTSYQADKIDETFSGYSDVQLVRDDQGRILAPNGKPSNLNEHLARIVRTPAFKRWFGDWEKLSHRQYLEGEPIARLTGKEYEKTEEKLSERVRRDYQDQYGGVISHPVFGKIDLIKGVERSIAHILNRRKSIAFAAVPSVIQNGNLIKTDRNYRGKAGVDRLYFAAPISIDNQAYACLCVVQKDKNKQGFYLHTVELKEKLEKSSQIGAATQKGTRLHEGEDKPALSKSLLYDVFTVNPSNVSKVVDENGEPRVVYHGTNTDFDSFLEGANFFTDNPDIANIYSEMRNWQHGGAARSMPVFLNIERPYHYDRSKEKVSPEEVFGYLSSDYDGIITSDIFYIPFEPTQIKSVFNRGAFSPNDARIQYSVTKKQANKVDDEIGTDAFGFFKEFMEANKKGWRKQRPDTSKLSELLSTPEHAWEKVPTALRVFNAAMRKNDNAFQASEKILGGPAGRNALAAMARLKKESSKEYKKLSALLFEADQNQEVLDLEKLRDKGFSEQAINAWKGFRDSMDRGLDMYLSDLKELVAQYEKHGLELPTIPVYKTNKEGRMEIVQADLKLALAQMGKMRGWYAPRIRRSGQYMITARKEGENPILEYYDTKAMVNFRGLQLQKKGYEITKDISGKLPESVYETAASVTDLQELINQALARSTGKNKKGVNLDDLGFEARWEKSADGQDDLVITGPFSKKQTDVFKSFGGKWYKAKEGSAKAWHFVGATKDLPEKLANTLSGTVADLGMDLLFARALIEESANILRGRGFRERMNQRSDAVGEEVWKGYEEDAATALAQYSQSLSHGMAKKQMALEMMKAFTGTDITWEEYKAERGESADYRDYQKMVKKRRIDAGKQPTIYKDVKSFMAEMLRNQEKIDRMMGVVKGLAVLKYLGLRVAAPVVNLTALATNVPAMMHEHGEIPIGQSYKLIGQAMGYYTAFITGKGSMPQSVRRVFEDARKNGWEEAQFNREALSVIQSKAARGWQGLIDFSMSIFGLTERLNRMATIAAAYQGIKQRKPRFSHEEALEQAKFISDRAHGVYGKSTLPSWARGASIGGQALRSAYVFKKFSHNYMLNMSRLAGKTISPKEDGERARAAKAFVLMAFSPAIFGGLGSTALQFALRPISNVISSMFGGGDDAEEELYNLVEDLLGPRAALTARYGLPGLIPGVTFKGSMAINLFDIPTNFIDLLGAPGSVFQDLYEGGELIVRGDVAKGLEKVLPNAVGTMIRANRERTEGVTRYDNSPIFYGTEPLRASVWETILRAASFNPARLAAAREKQWHEYQVESQYNEMRRNIYARVKRFYMLPAVERTPARWGEDVLPWIADYNERVKRSKLPGLSLITSKSIKSVLKRAFTPDKREKLRSANL